MEFLYKLYDMPNFGIILFAIIAILLILFLIILLFGKKDEKVRLEETRKLELANTEAFKDVDDSTKELKIPEIEQPVVEKSNNDVPTIENNIPKTEEKVEIPVVMPKEEPKVEEKPAGLELPKMAELPRLKEEQPVVSQPVNNNVIENQNSDASINNIFESIENETYDIK